MAESTITPETFLEHMAQSDEMVDHDGETCGMCHHMRLGAEVAREMIKAGEHEDLITVGKRATSQVARKQVLQVVARRKSRRAGTPQSF